MAQGREYNLRWKGKLKKAGLGRLAKGSHGIRIGTATTIAEPEGLQAAVETVGWKVKRSGQVRPSIGCAKIATAPNNGDRRGTRVA